jgi:hypothetical protein
MEKTPERSISMTDDTSGVETILLDSDDFMHPVEEASNFNESAYYNFFNHESPAYGGWLRIGNRPNEGYAEVTILVYEPNGTVGFNYMRPKISDNKAHDAGGVRFEVIEPWKEHRAGYSGKVCLLKDPLQLRDPSKAFKSNPFVPVEIDIQWSGISPAWGGEPRANGPDGKYVSAGGDDEFARGHFEQLGRTRGFIEIDGRRYEINGFGQRDHSWGPRYWQNVPSYQWLIMTFGEDLGMMALRVEAEDGDMVKGFYWEKGKPIREIDRMEVDTEYKGPDKIHDRIAVRAYPEGSHEPLEVTGKVLSVAPLRNRRAGWVTRISEGMTEWKLGDRIGYGMSEYLSHLQKGE